MIKLEDLDQEIIDLIEYTWRIESEDGNPPTPIEELVERYSPSLTAAIEFANPCNLPESGRFGPKGACGSTGSLPQRGGRYKDVAPAQRGGKVYGTPEHDAVVNAKQGDSYSAKGSSEEQAAARELAKRKIAEAPVPTRERVKKARLEMQAAQQGTSRPGGEGRGGSSYDRRNSRVNLFDEFGGFSRGYVVDPETGLKLHWADPRPQIPDANGTLRDNPDHVFNPEGYATFERGRIFRHSQGGGYQQPNLIPESFSSNRKRGSRSVRKEND